MTDAPSVQSGDTWKGIVSLGVLGIIAFSFLMAWLDPTPQPVFERRTAAADPHKEKPSPAVKLDWFVNVAGREVNCRYDNGNRSYVLFPTQEEMAHGIQPELNYSPTPDAWHNICVSDPVDGKAPVPQ